MSTRRGEQRPPEIHPQATAPQDAAGRRMTHSTPYFCRNAASDAQAPDARPRGGRLSAVTDVADDAHADAERVPGQVGQRQVLDLDDLQRRGVGAAADRASLGEAARLRRWPSSRGRFWKIWSTSPLTWAMAAPTALATAWWRTCTTSETPASALGHQEAAAADRDQRLLARVGLHPVDAFLDASRACAPARVLHERGRQVGHPRAVAEVDQAGGDGDVGGGERGAAEHAAPRSAGDSRRCAGPTAGPSLGRPAMPPPRPMREQIGHAEERAHAADLDDVVGLAREAVARGCRCRWWCRRRR